MRRFAISIQKKRNATDPSIIAVQVNADKRADLPATLHPFLGFVQMAFGVGRARFVRAKAMNVAARTASFVVFDCISPLP